MTRVMADPGHLSGNSAMLLSLNLSKLGAPMAGAIAAAFLPFGPSLLCAGVIFALAALLAWSVRATAQSRERTERCERFTVGFLRGFSELWRVEELRFLFLLSLIWRLFLGAQVSLFIVFIKRGLGGSDADYGLFMTYLGLGSLLGSLAGPWIARRLVSSLFVKLGMGLHFATFIVLSRVPSLSMVVFVSTVGFAILYASVVGAHSLRDHATSGAIRGRVFGANTAILSIAGMASMLAGGRLADLYGVNAVLLGAGTLALASLLALHLLTHPLEVAAQPEA
jgi:MFS transporter, DHA3 family, macrolide efflux protein